MDLIENLKAALNGEEVEKVPAISATAAAVEEAFPAAGVTWPDAHKDAEQMAKLGVSLHEQVGLECARIPFDLTAEAEAFGCEVDLGDMENTPTLRSNAPIDDPDDLEVPDDFVNNGRLPVILKSIEILKNEYPDVPVVVGMAGPFTLTGHLLGVEDLVKMLKTDSFVVEDAVDVALEAQIELVDAFNESGVDVICVADPTSSPELLDPNDFSEFAQPALEDLSAEMEMESILHICGNSRPILEDMLDCGFNGISVEEAVNMEEAQELRADIDADTVMVGNISTSQTLFSKTPADVKAEVTQALERGTNVLAPSCGIAPKSPLANLKAFVEARDEFYQ
ncbi:methylcobamide:CoM methyltransferase MtaA [Candidatus Methanosphaera massiliense]|jgi:[methyl-Co(III) methanol-specific corrinoid protein]:coenzyme M methyltransferase|uniref:methylcobamide:CoM methyltransferase MtaA n=1 Tax=Methanosphaera TaxID=2316 RepID=UPI000DC33315|nr:methylcobamide:CoM methyltransferase MtaA [Candidatus Methanosphaera massiliense]MDE4078147.1 methylcobamide:CoM methyltransferase MtaA [Candidatus Methanosphaera massiliense]RAP43466.1 MAG: methyltransferase [Methanosphaera sp. SHI1033]